MSERWKYMSEDNGLAGTSILTDGIGPRAIVKIESAGPGHCLDTGNMIAKALNDAERRRFPPDTVV